jgi:Fe-S cluster assembly protein SufD
MSDWLDIARNQAEERFRSLPLPTAKDENYRFSPVALPGEAAASAAGLPSDLAALDEEEAALLLLQGEEATFRGSLAGAVFTDLDRAVLLGLDMVRSRLSHELFPQDKFAQLTASRWKNGAFLHVPAGVKLRQPVRAAYFAAEGEEHFRNLISLEDGSEAVFVQEWASAEGDRFASELTEIRPGRGAKLHWVVLQRFEASTRSYMRQKVELAEGAELKITPLHLGGGVVQLRQEVELGQEARLETLGAARGNGSQQFDFWLDVDHQGSRSRSEMEVFFVMGGQSKGVFNGLIHIRKDAADCEASQKSKSLLLGAKATVHAMPKLIIQTDAVKCSHGASVSTVNPEQLHYLQSRGISRLEAERMIVRGFTEPALERLPLESLRGRTEATLDKMEGAGRWLQ